MIFNEMKPLRITAVLICAAFGSAMVQAAPLSETDKQFLSRYERIRSALAADNLAAAKTAAGDLGEEGATLTKSNSLKEARTVFEKLSDKATRLAAGQSGYYVVNCPMLKKGWVQTNDKIANPYYGKEMATCGEIKK
jgi:hypothetical protein